MRSRLEAFLKANPKFRRKGALSLALVVTDHAKNKGLPLDPDSLKADSEGQVVGLGKGRVQAILERNGITRVLAEEGGRTNRGNIKNMRTYLNFLNQAHKESPPVDLDFVEQYWIEQVKTFFAGHPFKLQLDETLGLRTVIRRLLSQAESRQQEMSGSTYQGTVMQHLVGAKLDLALGVGQVEHHGASQKDEADGRHGDFDIGDVSIHVSTSPGEALIRKCQRNLDNNVKPIIVTTTRGVIVADGLASNTGIADRIDIIEIEQFISTNIYELGKFVSENRRIKINELVTLYNKIVTDHETDPSLRIEIPSKR